MLCGIYAIKNIDTGKLYIGSSKRIPYRMNVHRKRLNENRHDNQHLQNAWNKYGKDRFEFYLIEECDEKQLFEREQYYVDYYTSLPEGVYNICTIVQNLPNLSGIPKTEEHRKKIGKAHKGISKPIEQRKKISESIRKYFSEHPEAKDKLRFRRLGMKLTEEQKMVYRGRKLTPEERKKLSESKKRGSEHHNARLTEDMVREIRRKYVPGEYGAFKLAKEYRVDKKTIMRILQNKTWTHIL
jgi:group I intron endonuclease